MTRTDVEWPDQGPKKEDRTGPLAGVRVLDLTSVVMGPWATQILGDLGADVITIESLDGGMNRDLGRRHLHQGLSGLGLNLLRNKRSVSANLKDAGVRLAVLKVAVTCDIVITNLRPKSLASLGLTYADFSAVRADIIYCAAQGFRSDGPRANDPAYDDIIQAESGLADAAARTGRDPMLAPTIIADKVSGMTVVNAVLAAFIHRQRTGRGQYVEVPMLEAMRAFILVELGGDAIRDPNAPPGYARVFSPARGPQRTKDGWINMLPYSTADYDALFAEAGLHDLVGGERSATYRAIVDNATFLYGKLRELAATKTTAEWLAFCTVNAIPVGRVRKLDELVSELPAQNHPVIGAYRHIPQPIRFDDSPTALRRHAPLLGQDSIAVLKEAGVADEEIEAMIARGAIAVPSDDG
ncbi:MAG: CoA transferase [Rhodospirillaceae bacterium]|nr:MAG: CoA transferase [Rhodospirillaceae bacterium]